MTGPSASRPSGDEPADDRAPPGSDAPERARLFVAVLVPEAVLDQLEMLPRPQVPGVRWTRRAQWHVTLRFFGHTEVAPVRHALATRVWRSAEAVLGPRVGHLGRRVVVLPVTGLAPLAEAVVRATGDLGKPPERRPFVGHLTLARRDGAQPVGLDDVSLQARWPVSEIALMRSTLRRTGAEYDVVATFPCR